MMHTIGRLAAISTLALAGTGFLAAGPSMAHSSLQRQAAVAMTSYSSAAYSYSLSYPTTWKVEKVQGVDLAITSPGHHAGLVAIIKKGVESNAALNADLKSLLSVGGKIQGTPKYSAGTINGINYPGWTATTVSSRQAALTISFGTVHGKNTYLFVGGVDLKLPSTKANAQVLEKTIASIKLR